jgi:hypothetical protein
MLGVGNQYVERQGTSNLEIRQLCLTHGDR